MNMEKDIVCDITNPNYRYNTRDLFPVNGYLIVGETDGKAVLNHLGEHIIPHNQLMFNYVNDYKIPVRRVFCGGDILKLAELKDKFNKKPIEEVLGKLESELLK